MGLGRNIKRLREAKGMTLQQLADLSGVPGGTIHALEARHSVRSKYAAQLAAALEVSTDSLVGHPPSYLRGPMPPNRAQAHDASPSRVTILPLLH